MLLKVQQSYSKNQLLSILYSLGNLKHKYFNTMYQWHSPFVYSFSQMFLFYFLFVSYFIIFLSTSTSTNSFNRIWIFLDMASVVRAQPIKPKYYRVFLGWIVCYNTESFYFYILINKVSDNFFIWCIWFQLSKRKCRGCVSWSKWFNRFS